MRLERVTGAHRSGYLRMVEDFEAAGEEYGFNDTETARRDFARFVADLDEEAAGVGLPPGAVAQTTFVLVEEETGDVVAEFRYRPAAGEPWTRHHGHTGYNVRPGARRRGFAAEGLRLLLVHAAADGLAGLALTIEPGNVGSQKAAAANGGYLRSPAAELAEPDGEDLWWIPVPQAAG